MTYVAMDVHKNRSTLAYVTPSSSKPVVVTVPTSRERILSVLQDLQPPRVVAVEACRQSPAVCRWLRPLGVEIKLVDAQKLEALAKLNSAKTDKADARFMLDRLLIGDLPEAYLAPEGIQQWRTLSRGRTAFVHQSTALRNRNRTIFNQYGFECPVSDLRGKGACERMHQWLAMLPDYPRMVATHCWTSLEVVEMLVHSMDAAIRKPTSSWPQPAAPSKTDNDQRQRQRQRPTAKDAYEREQIATTPKRQRQNGNDKTATTNGAPLAALTDRFIEAGCCPGVEARASGPCP